MNATGRGMIFGATAATAGVMRVFHDTWFYGLLEGLRDVYPATKQALGEPAFNAFANLGEPVMLVRSPMTRKLEAAEEGESVDTE